MSTLLLSDDFDVEHALVSNPAVLRARLQRSPEVLGLRSAVASGLVTVEQLSVFVGELMEDFRVGVQFAHDTALCALTVVLESIPGEYADEFLADLAKVKRLELSRPARVAAECLQSRSAVAANVVRRVQLSSVPYASSIVLAAGGARWRAANDGDLVEARYASS